MEKITRILPGLVRPPKKNAIQHEWQAFAYKVWKEYDGDPKTLPNVIRFFKQYNTNYRRFLDHAYSFCVDYQGAIPKIKLFYWKFWQLKKQAVVPGETLARGSTITPSGTITL